MTCTTTWCIQVGISAFLCHGQEHTWFIRVNETLCKASAGPLSDRDNSNNSASASAMIDTKTAASASATTDSSGNIASDGSMPMFEHQLSNVNFVNLGHTQRIKCVVDNQV
jgi:hypothetical protein